MTSAKTALRIFNGGQARRQTIAKIPCCFTHYFSTTFSSTAWCCVAVHSHDGAHPDRTGFAPVF